MERFLYVKPYEPLGVDQLQDLLDALDRHPSLVVIDGITDAMSMHDLNPDKNADVAKFFQILPRIAAKAGAAVLLLDHVTKSTKERGRWATGAQHKMAGTDGTVMSMTAAVPFNRDTEGSSRIYVEKDRSGFLKKGAIGVLSVQPWPDGRLSLTITPPEERPSSIRPTVLMEKVSNYVAANPGASKRGVTAGVGGNATYLRLAVELLVNEGYLVDEGKGQSSSLRSLRAFRKADDRGPPGIVRNEADEG